MSFEQFVLTNEPAIRLGFFLGLFAVIGAWELVAPRRALTISKALRWTSNLGLVALNTALQLNVALLIDRLLGLRNASMLKPAAREASAGKPHFIGQAMVDEQGRVWYELDLAALSADEAFLKIDV